MVLPYLGGMFAAKGFFVPVLLLMMMLGLSTCSVVRFELASGHLTATPELAFIGPYAVGVQTIDVIDARRQRPLRLEVWYPTPQRTGITTTYSIHVGSRSYPQQGEAYRNAPVLQPTQADGSRFPLVVYSHGQPDDRLQMALVAEQLAAQGIVVAAIDHTGSTYRDVVAESYVTSLADRPEDVLFAISEIPQQFPADGARVGLMGFSYGGYTSINVAGVGLDSGTLKAYCDNNWRELWLACAFQHLMSDLEAKRGTAVVTQDPRIKAVMVFAPYGAPFVSTTQLQNLRVPLFIAGNTLDDTATYQRDARGYFENAGSRPKYLLTLHGANHTAWKLCPDVVVSNPDDWRRCQPQFWRPNEAQLLARHFATAFFSRYLLGKTSFEHYLGQDLAGAYADDAVDLEVIR
jgi:predicted dienelactone hydrolase